MPISDDDLTHLRRCVDLAREAVDQGDQPFGSVLVLDGEVLVEDHNRIAGGDRTQHPEFALARWAAAHLTEQQRQAAVVYTSGEHCPMCAAAHGWVGLGPIFYATSTPQLVSWLTEFGAPPSPIRPLRITEVIIDAQVTGPVPEFADEVRGLHARYYGV